MFGPEKRLMRVVFIEPHEIFPELGVYSFPDMECRVRADLPPMVRKGVIAHELGHHRFQTTNERLPIIYGFLVAPIASFAVIGFVLTNKAQRQGVWDCLLRRVDQ